MYTKSQIAQTIDHAALKPNMTDADITANCELGKKYGVKSVCIRPSDVPLAAKLLKGSQTLVCVGIGFPHGANKPETKAFETKTAIDDGAVEVDMVMNIGKFLSGDYAWVQRDIAGVVKEAKPRNVIVKVILESGFLKPDQIKKACEICRDAGADFVKTSTGFGEGCATPESIQIMIDTVGKTMGVKASGGVRTYETACAFLKQGCTRLGVAATAAILDAAPEREGQTPMSASKPAGTGY